MHKFYENMLLNSRLLLYFGRKKINNFPYSKKKLSFCDKKVRKKFGGLKNSVFLCISKNDK